ncbi:MAG TPA: hypothetical protein VGP72_14605 [Planctomycetota bacterium]|jgi:hypothetical protein
MSEHVEEPALVKGGQGHSGESLASDAKFLFWAFLILACVLTIALCGRVSDFRKMSECL